VNVNEETYHMLDSFLSGKLKGRALDKFKIDLKNDASMREALATQKSLIKAVEIARQKELKSFITEELNKTTANTLHPKMRITLASAAAIALIAVAIFSLAPLSQKENKDTVQKEQKIPLTVAEISASDTAIAKPEIVPKEIKQTDTQTLAIVEPIPILEVEPETESIEDYNSNIDYTDTVEESMAFDFADDMSVEEDRYTVNEKPRVATEATSVTEQAEIKDADLIVRSDELLGKKTYTVYAAALNQGNRANATEELTPQSIDKQITQDKKIDAKNDSVQVRGIAVKDLVVEYWQSVVNYTGYQYNGNQLKLYGVDQLATLQFLELDSRLYIKIGGEQYFLENNAKHNRLIQVTNPTLLKVLNE